MPDVSLLTTEEYVFPVTATDSATPANPRTAAFAAQVDNYPGAYLAIVGNNTLHFVARDPGDYTVTIGGHSQDGTALPNITVSFHVSVPPVPQATKLVAGAGTIRTQDTITPADPGTNTVTGTV